MAHANARLTIHGKVILIHRVVVDECPVAHAAKERGISRRYAHRDFDLDISDLMAWQDWLIGPRCRSPHQ